MKTSQPISIVIPTFGREQVLLDTLKQLFAQQPAATEIVVVDQTPTHHSETIQQLEEWDRRGWIRWLLRTEPSIPKSMNYGLQQATQPIVLFLDDDIRVGSGFVAAHVEAHRTYPEAKAVVGQVLQPGEHPRVYKARGVRQGLRADLEFPFLSDQSMVVRNVMAGNLSVERSLALQVGGFDENFSGVAYRFETEFARRMTAAGAQIRFWPAASINHLRAERGGTRSTGSHLTSADPKHGIGDYYYAFLHGTRLEAWRYSVYRLFREVRTRFHATHPWWIPVKLLGEWRAFWAGRKMAMAKRAAD